MQTYKKREKQLYFPLPIENLSHNETDEFTYIIPHHWWWEQTVLN